MAIVNIFLTILIVIAVFIITGKVMKSHLYYGRVKIPMEVPKTFLALMAIVFAVSCVWQFVIDTFDDMRYPDFWISLFSTDPILGEVFETAEEYDLDLGMPTAEFGPNDFLMIENVTKNVAISLWCAVIGLAVYIIYIFGLFKNSRPILVGSLLLFACAFVMEGRAASAGMIHLVNYITSGMGTNYDGDMSNSVMLPFFTIVASIIAAVGVIRGFSQTKKYLESVSYLKEPHTDQCQNSNSAKEHTLRINNATSRNIFANDNRGKAEKLTELKTLLDAGILTEEEFTNMKHQILKS